MAFDGTLTVNSLGSGLRFLLSCSCAEWWRGTVAAIPLQTQASLHNVLMCCMLWIAVWESQPHNPHGRSLSETGQTVSLSGGQS
jgi:hypothetical protein